MTHPIKAIPLSLPFHMGSVNCYLAESESGFFLIDTGGSNQRAELEKVLAEAGCEEGDLKLILITHGDFDHCGNAAYLRKKLGARIAMHPGDLGMVERGDMFWNRGKGNILLGKIIPLLAGFGAQERFKPDITVEDGYDLSEYGFKARVLSIPGHSKGSIGILTDSGELFCGDLMENTKEPALNSLMVDSATAHTSLEKLSRSGIRKVYPGHGKPFSLEAVLRDYL
jgi:glyoxylase-like metal-dependent hydrolase (beta-lactamase superfamily II)